MQCPQCKAVCENSDKFCMSCGFLLEGAGVRCPDCGNTTPQGGRFCPACGRDMKKTQGNGHILLKQEELAAIAGSHEYTALSPLAVYYQGFVEKKQIALETTLLNAVLNPSRAFYLMELTANSFQQDVLLVRDSSYFRWEEDDPGVSISKEVSPRVFIARITTRLEQYMLHENTSGISIRKEYMRVLAGVNVLCRELSTIDQAAAFITMSHLESFLDSRENLAAIVGELSMHGFVRLIGKEDPLIVLEPKGEELFLLLNAYDRFFIIQVLAEGVSGYPSINFAARNGVLYLITNDRVSGDLVIRGMDREGMRSLISWSWTSAVI